MREHDNEISSLLFCRVWNIHYKVQTNNFANFLQFPFLAFISLHQIAFFLFPEEVKSFIISLLFPSGIHLTQNEAMVYEGMMRPEFSAEITYFYC